ncbi:uncharacterized protein LOC125037833 [Penaeus chinensis]|uniref:uncharacterized protein LOC125037833 n=1 Tax=Penaeus chinensis TaxID=139456 RepID=UPI001FB646EF|nr:uncharacterized protein LOC125037833 [Penaeus chinensis]
MSASLLRLSVMASKCKQMSVSVSKDAAVCFVSPLLTAVADALPDTRLTECSLCISVYLCHSFQRIPRYICTTQSGTLTPVSLISISSYLAQVNVIPGFPDYIFDNYEREKKKRKSKKNKVPLATIEGPTERHIQQGSILAITCIVHHMPHSAPAHILWFHGPQNIDYDSPRGGVSIQTEKAARKTVSKLMLSTVTLEDTGEYSCAPSDLQPAVVNVHVQIGEETVGQIQQPVKQGPGLSGAAVTASVSSALLAMLLVALACVKCRVFA